MATWGGMVLKGGCRDAVPPVGVLVSLSRLCGGRVEWRGVVCAVVSPSSNWILLFVLSLPLFCLVCGGVFVVGGEVRWCVV